MPPLLTQIPNMGLNALVADNALDMRNAADGSENVVYEYGVIRSPYGFGKVDCSSPLVTGEPVLAVFQWTEIDRTTHLTAVMQSKILDHNRVTTTWDDKTKSGATYKFNLLRPISWAAVGHDDTNIYLDDDSSRANAYHHLIVCGGSNTDIQRWAGKNETDFANLTGGGGYHDGTTHRALQVTRSERNRMLLISPYEYNSSSLQWVANPQRVRWPTIGKIQTWTGTGSGFAELMQTGGVNVWSASLAGQQIVYQTKGIWTLSYVGGNTVFDPDPLIQDLGLLDSHLLIAHRNIHYFMGTDYNIYAYFGGTVLKSIGDSVQKYFIEDADPDYTYRAWMTLGPKAKFLWIFLVETGNYNITKAYRRNMITGKWMVRDFTTKYTTSATGITSASLASSEAYIVGDTYRDALDTKSIYDQSDAGDTTIRYGDMLIDTSRTLAADYTTGTWSAGGFDYSKNAENFDTDFTDNDILLVTDGSDATNVRYGNHYYTTYDVSTNGFSIYGSQDVSTQGDHGIADNSTNVPADLSVSGKSTLNFYSVCSEDNPGETYNQAVEQITQKERLVFGDSDGYVYKIDQTYTADDGNVITQRHRTPVFDNQMPGNYKRWPGYTVTAKGTSMTCRHRTSNFDTSETGWSEFTQSLTSDYEQYDFWINDTSKRIQFEFRDFSGDDMEIREFEILEPLIEEGR